MEFLDIVFQVLGTVVVASPALLLAVLGLSSLVGRPLGESSISRLTQASVLLSLIPAVIILLLMLVAGTRYVPIEIGNWVTIPEEEFHFHLKFVFDRLSIPFLLLSCVLCGVVGDVHASLPASRGRVRTLLSVLRGVLLRHGSVVAGRHD